MSPSPPPRLLPVAGVEGGLPAARLGEGDPDVDAEPLEDGDGGEAHAREERVGEAGGKQGNADSPFLRHWGRILQLRRGGTGESGSPRGNACREGRRYSASRPRSPG